MPSQQVLPRVKPMIKCASQDRSREPTVLDRTTALSPRLMTANASRTPVLKEM